MRTIIVAFVLFLPSLTTLGGFGTISGKERGFWTEDRTSVVVGTIGAIHARQVGEPQEYQAMFVPLATLAGSLDPSLRRVLDVRFFAGSDYSSIDRLPANGAIVVAVVQLDRFQADEREPSNWIVSDLCLFMPKHSGLVVVDGLNDPRVAETLKKIQGTREAADRAERSKLPTQPSGPPATQPTTQPGD